MANEDLAAEAKQQIEMKLAIEGLKCAQVVEQFAGTFCPFSMNPHHTYYRKFKGIQFINHCCFYCSNEIY